MSQEQQQKDIVMVPVVAAAAPQQSTALASWEGAAQRGLAARREREAIIAEVLVKDQDYGVIPGTNKPTLLKSGAEKIADCLNLCPSYELIGKLEDWTAGRFAYQYRCRLILRGSDVVVATGIGSCNSMENRYRWRTIERRCPECGAPAVVKGNPRYNDGQPSWFCWKKKGGCSAKWTTPEQMAMIEKIEAGKVENDDPYSQVNTYDKMAQKRSLVAATLNLGFSHKFTQDVEDGVTGASDDGEKDWPEVAGQEKKSEPPKQQRSAAPASGPRVITEKQSGRLYAIRKQGNVPDDAFAAILKGHGFTSDRHITEDKYELIVDQVRAIAAQPAPAR